MLARQEREAQPSRGIIGEPLGLNKVDAEVDEG
jgi:hypothetical protein